MYILVLITHYHNEAELKLFVEHLIDLRAEGQHLRVQICDNSGNLGEPSSWLKRGGEGKGIELGLIRPAHNLGYMGGCALALEGYYDSAEVTMPDWILICNTDLSLEADFFDLLQKTPPLQDLGVLAPSVRRSDGTDHNPYKMKAPSEAHVRALLLVLSFPSVFRLYEALSRVCYRYRSSRTTKEAQAMYAPHGSLMIVHPQFFALGGTLVSDAFMYHEELYIGAQCHHLGLKVWYDPRLKASHREASTTAGISLARRCAWRKDALRMILRWQKQPGSYTG